MKIIPEYYPGHPYIEGIIEKASLCSHIFFDGFAGLGGVTDGIMAADGNWYVVCCINHSPSAIASHMANHPECLHLMEDFRTANLDLAYYIWTEVKKRNPSIKGHGWFSVDCTSHSNAKGGMPRDADSRTLAEDIYRYIEVFDFDVVWLENVREFLIWGPVIPKVIVESKGKKSQLFFNPERHDVEEFFAPYINASAPVYCPLVVKKAGKKIKENYVGPWMIPDPPYKGRDFKAWNESIKAYGYDSSWKLLNSADYGVPQTRVRLIMQFTRKGIPAVWPTPSHDKKGAKGLPKWVAVRTVLDLDDEGESVLGYKPHKIKGMVPRIKSAKTIKRLIKGTTKHALTGERKFLDVIYGNGYSQSLKNAGPTVRCKDGAEIVTTKFIVDYNHSSHSADINDSSRVVTCHESFALSSVQFLDKQYNGDGENHQSINEAAGAVTGNNKLAPVTIHFVDHQYSSGQTDKSIDETSGCLLANPKQRLVEVERFISNFQYDNELHSIEDPCRTLLAGRKHYYIISAQYSNLGIGIENPAQTLIARMDKKPPYLIITEFGELAIEVYDYDPPHLIELKAFMAKHGIVRMNMRMLNNRELKRIQSLSGDYITIGTETDQKKQIGNAVPKMLVTALARCYHEHHTPDLQYKLFPAA